MKRLLPRTPELGLGHAAAPVRADPGIPEQNLFQCWLCLTLEEPRNEIFLGSLSSPQHSTASVQKRLTLCFLGHT